MNGDRLHILLFVAPGIISLLILPLLLLWHVYRTPLFPTLETMEINIFPDSNLTASVHSLYPGEDVPPNGSWTTYQILKDHPVDTSQFSVLRSVLRAHVTERDTEHGICIHFNRDTPYESFVRIVDILNLEMVSRFWIAPPNIWVPKFPRAHNSKSMPGVFICGGVIVRRVPVSY